MADLSNGTTIGGFRQLHENLQKPTLFDDLTVPTLQINDVNTKILEGTSNSIRIQTNSGYVDIGPQNTSLSHFNTDRPKFYFNQPIQINGNIESDGGTRTITGFNLSGNASTQSKLQTARTISLAGDVTGSTTFDGSQNVSISATVVDDSHSHSNATITSVDWSKLTNLPDPTITLSGDVTGQQTMTNLGSITITSTVGDDSHSHSNSTITSVDWSKLTNVPDPTITLSGDVTGQQTMTNLGSITISATVANDSHTHDTRYYTESEADSRFVNVTGDTMTGNLTILKNKPWLTLDSSSSGDNLNEQQAGISIGEAGTGGQSLHLVYTGDGYQYIGMGSTSPIPQYKAMRFYYTNNNVLFYGTITATKVYGAVYNDYAEYRSSDEPIDFGYVQIEDEKGNVIKCNEDRSKKVQGVSTDTLGFQIGKQKDTDTPIAVAGRVLVYQIDKHKLRIGDQVCSTKEGKVRKMKWWEKIFFPEQIVGYVSEFPDYDIWGSDNIKVNGRIWIRI